MIFTQQILLNTADLLIEPTENEIIKNDKLPTTTT